MDIPLHHHMNNGTLYPDCKRCKLEQAAPDLLAACEELYALADNGSASFDDPEPGSPYLKAKAAIEKAKGE